jgi:hypothetical protein
MIVALAGNPTDWLSTGGEAAAGGTSVVSLEVAVGVEPHPASSIATKRLRSRA